MATSCVKSLYPSACLVLRAKTLSLLVIVGYINRKIGAYAT